MYGRTDRTTSSGCGGSPVVRGEHGTVTNLHRNSPGQVWSANIVILDLIVEISIKQLVDAPLKIIRVCVCDMLRYHSITVYLE